MRIRGGGRMIPTVLGLFLQRFPLAGAPVLTDKDADMEKLKIWLPLAAALVLGACATTPDQVAARKAAQKRQEQALQVELASQCDEETAKLMAEQFNPPPFANAKQREQFRLRYVDKVSNPMFQACYKMAWQNHISQIRLQRARDFYDDWYSPLRYPWWYW